MENQQAELEVEAFGVRTGTCREGKISRLAGQKYCFEAIRENDNWQRMKILKNIGVVG